MAKRPQVQGRKAMDVLLKWAKKQFALEAPKDEKNVEEVKDVEMTEEKKDGVKKEDADKTFDNEQMLDLSHNELYNIMAKRPQVQGRKAMDVLLKWAKKQFALEAPKVEKKEEVVEKEEKNVEEVKDVEMTEEKKDDV